MKELSSPFDSRALRTSLGSFVTGVTVITTKDDNGKLHGLTANSFNTVSIDPPLILWSQGKNAGSYEVFKSSKEFAISILAEDQTKISAKFATKSENKFEGVDVNQNFCELPVIQDSSAWMYCKMVSQFDGGDHTIYIGEIMKIAHNKKRPLVFGGGQYLLAQSHYDGFSSFEIPKGDIQRHFLKMATPKMQQLADELDITVCASVWGSKGPTIVAWEKGQSNIMPSFPIGMVVPVTQTSIGKAFAAYLSHDQLMPFIENELEQHNANLSASEQDLSQFYSELEEIKKTSIAFEMKSRYWQDELFIDAQSLMLRDQSDHPVLTITAVTEHGNSAEKREQITQRLLEISKQIELQLKKN